MQLNDYLLGAMSLVDSVMIFNFPRKIIFVWEQILTFRKPSVRGDGFSFDISFKGYSALINMVEIPRQVMFTVYVTSTLTIRWLHLFIPLVLVAGLKYAKLRIKCRADC